MNKKLITVGLIILSISIFGKLIFSALRNIKVDEFHKASVIFILDTSVSNKNMLATEQMFIKSLCAVLDPEDSIKILKSAESSYLIFEGTPSDFSGIKKTFEDFANNSTNESAYGEAIKKAVDLSISTYKEGYIPAIVVIGDLENDAEASKQINWETLPKNISKTIKYLPDLTMMFVYAHPQKLDIVKTKLNPILGEKKLIIANSANIDKANRRFLQAIGR